MKAVILFTFLTFPFLFYFEPQTFTGEIDCDVTFYSVMSQSSEEIPFTYETDCELSYLELEVFDQWGENIYSTDDPNFQWFGRKVIIDGEGNLTETILPEGTYYFVAKYKFDEKGEIQKQGGAIKMEL